MKKLFFLLAPMLFVGLNCFGLSPGINEKDHKQEVPVADQSAELTLVGIAVLEPNVLVPYDDVTLSSIEKVKEGIATITKSLSVEVRNDAEQPEPDIAYANFGNSVNSDVDNKGNLADNRKRSENDDVGWNINNNDDSSVGGVSFNT